jgi:hypothetical protein
MKNKIAAIAKPGRKVLKVGSKIPNKIGRIPRDEVIRNGIAALTELSEAGYDLPKITDDRLFEIWSNLEFFDLFVHWTAVKVTRENLRRSLAAEKARKQK